MIAKTQAVSIALVAAGLLAMGSVRAELIDFTDNNVWPSGSVSSPQSSSVGDYNLPGIVTVSTANGQNLRWDSDYAGPTNDLAGVYDGVGIVDDEITDGATSAQILNVAFSVAAKVNRLDFLDLFSDGDGNGGAERIQVTGYLNNVQTATLGAGFWDGTDPNPPRANGGYLSAIFTAVLVDKLVFEMVGPPNGGIDDGTRDAAVAAIGVVPIPAALWLFGSALMGLAGVGYRRNGKV